MANHLIILIFGARNTYGAGDPEGGWVSRMRRQFETLRLEKIRLRLPWSITP
jgi:hypothetical protein